VLVHDTQPGMRQFHGIAARSLHLQLLRRTRKQRHTPEGDAPLYFLTIRMWTSFCITSRAYH
jgi:hypothetical protein